MMIMVMDGMVMRGVYHQAACDADEDGADVGVGDLDVHGVDLGLDFENGKALDGGGWETGRTRGGLRRAFQRWPAGPGRAVPQRKAWTAAGREPQSPRDWT